MEALRPADLNEDDLERIAALLGPLGSPLRLRLLRFLTRPHYLEEVGSHLKLTRQAARKHLDKLVAIGVLERRPGVRDTGPVTEYVLNPRALFLIYDEFEKLGSLHRQERDAHLVRTLHSDGGTPGASPPAGPSLTIVRGFQAGRRFALMPGRDRLAVLGRDPHCLVPLEHDPYASNKHAELRRDGARYILTDLRSTNGTTHNWATLPRGGEVALRHGDVVGVGKTLMLFWEG